MSSYDPHTEYSTRLYDRQRALRELNSRSDYYGNVRVVLFLLGTALAVAAYMQKSEWLLVLFPGAAFLVIVVLHELLARRQQRAELAAQHYEAGLARLAGRYDPKLPTGAAFVPKHHPYAWDLDLFGPDSLYQRICTARTQFGQAALARAMLTCPTVDHIKSVQAAVEELRHRLDLREDLAILGPNITRDVREGALLNWVATPPVLEQTSARFLAWAIALAGIISILGYVLTGISTLLVLALAFSILAHYRYRVHLIRVGESVDTFSRELNVLGFVLSRLEREPFRAPLLQELHSHISSDGLPASRHIRKLDRLVNLFNLQRNMMFAPIALLTAWPLHFALALEQWRLRHRDALAQWTEALGQLESLCAIAAYAYESPADPFPELHAAPPTFEAQGLGHPMLRHDKVVRNDVTLGRAPQVLLVSGSNMSGKSTLLRTVGANAVLAFIGAPVRARSLRLTPMQIGATIYVQDSIQEGASRFYAEIQRFQAIFQMAANGPLLFLVDEILHGTNSHDRQIGAQALIKTLIEQQAIGLVTTHDLALTGLPDEVGDLIQNVHFADDHADGHLKFDYTLRAGVVRHSNALELMRSLGLPV